MEVLLASFPVQEAGLVMGPALVTEARMLAVPSGHRFARRESVSVKDLARVKVLQAAGTLQDPWPGSRTPAGQPIEPGPSAATLQEILTLVGAGQGAFPVGSQTRRYYARPDVTYVPLRDAPSLEWGLIWREDGATARVRAFAQAADDLVSKSA